MSFDHSLGKIPPYVPKEEKVLIQQRCKEVDVVDVINILEHINMCWSSAMIASLTKLPRNRVKHLLKTYYIDLPTQKQALPFWLYQQFKFNPRVELQYLSNTYKIHPTKLRNALHTLQDLADFVKPTIANQIETLVKQGMTQVEIRKLLDVRKTYVNDVIREKKLKPKLARKRIFHGTYEEIRARCWKFFAKGYNRNSVSKRTGLHYTVVTKHYQEWLRKEELAFFDFIQPWEEKEGE